MVVGEIGVERAPDREGRIGVGVVEHHVDAVRARLRRAGEVDQDVARVGIDGERALENDLGAAGNVEPALAAIGAALELADRVPRGALGPRDYLVRQRVDVVEPVPVAEDAQPLRADPSARYLRREVAHHLVRRAHVVADNVVQQRVGLARLVELRAGDPEPLLVNVARARADAVAADIGVVDGRSEESDRAALAEHRGQHRDVEEVAGRQPRVVGHQHVALGEVVGREGLDEMGARGGQRIDVARRPRHRLGDHPALAVEQRAGEVARLAHHRAERDALQRAGLLGNRGDQVRPENFELDSVHAHPSHLATMQPSSRTSARQPAIRKIVVSRSSIMAGPATSCPAESAARS